MTTPVTGAAKTSLPQFVSPQGAKALAEAGKAMPKDGLRLSQKPAEPVLNPEMSRFEVNTRKTLAIAGIGGCMALMGAFGLYGTVGYPLLQASLMQGASVLAIGLMGVMAWGVAKMKMGQQD